MFGRSLAAGGWLAWQVGRPFGAAGGGRVARVVPVVVALVLLGAAAAPIVVPMLDPQPQDAVVQDIFDGAVTEPTGWVRLTGRLVPLRERPAAGPGRHALLVDAENPLRAVVVRSDGGHRAIARVTLTGTLRAAAVEVTEELPTEARVAGTPPQVVPDALVELDAVPKPTRSTWWPLGVPPALLALMLLVGSRTGYPVFQPTVEIDVLAVPMTPGDRVPTAYGGRIGDNRRPLTDPGGALLLVRPGPTGSVLTAQPLAEPGSVAPQPVPIGGGWTSGRMGIVHTLTESVPALAVRSELVDATFLFARAAERDRVAALVAVER